MSLSIGRPEAIARFKATGGQPPAGNALLGRWTAADFSGGFVLLESDDVKRNGETSLPPPASQGANRQPRRRETS
ncbi:MAG TPA: DUF3303 family protein [Thermoanaerobaculia bacterium]|nr:DUF3303 family protein [Thermoanaerobaculia bacterium]